MSAKQPIHIDASGAFQKLNNLVFFVPPDASVYMLAYGRDPDDTRLPFSETAKHTVRDFFNGIVMGLISSNENVTLPDLIRYMHTLLDDAPEEVRDLTEDDPTRRTFDSATMSLRHAIPYFTVVLLGIDALDPGHAADVAAIRRIHENVIRQRSQRSNY